MPDSIESQITQVLQERPIGVFAEPHIDETTTQNGMAMSLPSSNSLLNISGGSIPVIALGVILSENVGSVVGRFTSQATLVKWGAVLAGVVIIMVAKNNRMLKSFGAGVLIGGLANIFRDVVGNISGSLGLSEPREGFMEDRTTWGGVDGGTSVTSPNRRVIQ